MGIDVLELIDKKGGNSEAVRESQRRRFANVELVDDCIGQYDAWVKRTCAIQLLSCFIFWFAALTP